MKLSIRGRVLTLVLTSVFAVLLLLGTVAFHSVRSSQLVIDRQEAVLEATVSEDELGRMANFKKMSEEVIADSQMKAGLLLLPLLALIVYACSYMAGRITRPIRQLEAGVQEIAAGNLERKVEIHTGDEVEHLADCFNTMTDELQTYMKNLTAAAAEKERILTELSVARNIQLGALPTAFPADRQSFELFADMVAALDVGGDFYDFYMTDEDHLVVTIADVCDKGIPAALFMMRAKTILKHMVRMAKDPDDLGTVMALANGELCQDNKEKMFVTVFLARLDLGTGELLCANCGHNPPLARRCGSICQLPQKNYYPPLGMMAGIRYGTYKLKLFPGDMVFLYTDGVTEAMNGKGELYSDKRLEEALERLDGEISVREVLESVKEDIEAHVNGAEQSDDITMLGLKFLG